MRRTSASASGRTALTPATAQRPVTTAKMTSPRQVTVTAAWVQMPTCVPNSPVAYSLSGTPCALWRLRPRPHGTAPPCGRCGQHSFHQDRCSQPGFQVAEADPGSSVLGRGWRRGALGRHLVHRSVQVFARLLPSHLSDLVGADLLRLSLTTQRGGVCAGDQMRPAKHRLPETHRHRAHDSTLRHFCLSRCLDSVDQNWLCVELPTLSES